MSVTSPASTLQAILNQIQAPAKPTAGARVASQAPDVAAPKSAARPVAPAQSDGVTQNGAATLNPNAPRGSYLNIVV